MLLVKLIEIGFKSILQLKRNISKPTFGLRFGLRLRIGLVKTLSLYQRRKHI